MERYALLGWPVKHSVSPQMQEAGFRALGVDATYELIEVAPAGLAGCIERLVADGYAGWNVTVPHKERMAKYMHDVDATAQAAGSVNTVVHHNGRLSGFSTDGYGLARAVGESFGIDVAGGRFLFLGCGGAARATSVHFACEGAAELVLVNRTLERAEHLARTVVQAAPHCRVTTHGLGDPKAFAPELARMDCVIQATSLGLHADDPAPMSPDLIPSRVAVMDMIYRETPFLRGVAARGCPVADGRSMLLYQGVRSFELWTHDSAPVVVMRRALHEALAARASEP